MPVGIRLDDRNHTGRVGAGFLAVCQELLNRAKVRLERLEIDVRNGAANHAC
jgi:hypothetical protein